MQHILAINVAMSTRFVLMFLRNSSLVSAQERVGATALCVAFGHRQVERVVLNPLGASRAALPPNICAFGDLCAIVLRTRRSTNAAGVTDSRLQLNRSKPSRNCAL
jgi:hypothetical protein